MTTESRLFRDEVKRYFDDIISLRTAIHQNITDYRFANEEYGQIKYIFDSNTVINFLNPLNDNSVPSIYFGGDSVNHLNSIIVTLEYLFSRELPGQNGEPPMISSQHIEEVQNHIRRRGNEAQKVISGQPDPEADRALVLEVLARLKRLEKSNSPLHYIEPLSDIVGRQNWEQFLGPLHEVSSLKRIYDNELLLPLDMDALATQDVVFPEAEEVNRWSESIFNRKKITVEYQNSRKSKAGGYIKAFDQRGGIRSLKHASRRDAITITQLLSLNDAAKDESKPVRYLLVTADRSMYEAYAHWYWTTGKFDEGRDFELRQQIQYLPILNVVDMPNRIGQANDQNDIFGKVSNAIDSLLTNIKNQDSRPYPDFLSSYVGIHKTIRRWEVNNPSMSRFVEAFSTKMYRDLLKNSHLLRELRQEWKELSLAASVLNTNLLSKRRNELSSLTQVFSADDFQKNALDFLASSLEEIELKHTQYSLPMNFAKWLNIDNDNSNTFGKRRRKKSRISLPRGFNFLRESYPSVSGEVSLGKYLISVLASNDSVKKQEVFKIFSGVSKLAEHDVMLISASIAFAANAWGAAYFYASRALEFFGERSSRADKRSNKTRREIELFVTHTRRFHASNVNVPTSYSLLMENEVPLNRLLLECEDENDDFGAALALSELALLRLTPMYGLGSKTVGFKSFAEQYRELLGGPDEWLDDAYEYCVRAERHLESCTEGVAEELLSGLKLQVKSALAGCLIYGAMYEGGSLDQSKPRLRKVKQEIDIELDKKEHDHPVIYQLASVLMELLLAEDGRQTKLARVHAYKALDRADQELEHITVTDRIGIVGLRDKLAVGESG